MHAIKLYGKEIALHYCWMANNGFYLYRKEICVYLILRTMY